MKKYIQSFIALLFFVPTYISIAADLPSEMPAICLGFEKFLGPLDHCDCKPLAGGLSNNTQYQCLTNGNKYVARVLKESLPQRQQEIATHLEAMHNEIAPKIYYHYSDDQFSLVIMDFIDGHTISIDQGRQTEVLDQIAQNVRIIAQFNPTKLNDENPKNLWDEINKNYEHVKARHPQTIEPMLDLAIQKSKSIHQRLVQANRPFVFGHNDLNPRNIFFTQNKIMIIDWENAAANYDYYDIASYSVFLCLHPSADEYLLTKYLQRTPSELDIQQFKDLKLMIRVFDTFSLLAFLKHIPESIDIHSINKFEDYETTFSQDSQTNSPDFLYKLALSQLEEFFKESKTVTN